MNNIEKYLNKRNVEVEHILSARCEKQHNIIIRLDGGRKWIVSYADVALNGGQRTLHDYSPEIDKNLTIQCYQPEPGYCACVLTEDKSIDICPEE